MYSLVECKLCRFLYLLPHLLQTSAVADFSFCSLWVKDDAIARPTLLSVLLQICVCTSDLDCRTV